MRFSQTNNLVGWLTVSMLINFAALTQAFTLDELLQGGKQEVTIGFYLLNVGYIDVRQGLWDCDFFLYFTSDASYYNIETAAIQRYFPNGHNPEAWQIAKMPVESNRTAQYRIKSKFYFTVDTSQLPFRQLQLQIIFEDPVAPISKLTFSGDPAFLALGQSFDVPGFSGSRISHKLLVSNHTYPPFELSTANPDRIFSRVVYTLHVKQPSLAGYIQCAPPIFFLLILGFNAILPVKHTLQRMSVVGFILMSATIYHYNVQAQAPVSGALSVIDHFMLLLYYAVTANFFVCLLIITYEDHNHVSETLRFQAIVWQIIALPLASVYILFIRQNAALVLTLVCLGLPLVQQIVRCMIRSNRGMAMSSRWHGEAQMAPYEPLFSGTLQEVDLGLDAGARVVGAGEKIGAHAGEELAMNDIRASR